MAPTVPAGFFQRKSFLAVKVDQLLFYIFFTAANFTKEAISQ
jgi:hypothetical protein